MDEKIVCLDNKSNGEINKEDEDIKHPGFRFHPTDEELVGFYLQRKVDNKRILIEIIKEIDIYKYDPWDLPRVSSVGCEKEWYFFCLRGRKYRNSIRPNRVTGSGFWKATGIDKPIYSVSDSSNCIGLKKSLVYYRGSAGKGNKTDWMMHEFRLPSNNKDTDQTCSPSMQEAVIWTLCRIFQRNISSKKYTQSAPKQIPADSSSKTSSFDSDTGEYEQYKLISNYVDEKNQLYGGQWNPTVLQAPLATSNIVAHNPNFPSGSLTKEAGNWDELGMIMDYYMMDPSVTSFVDTTKY